MNIDNVPAEIMDRRFTDAEKTLLIKLWMVDQEGALEGARRFAAVYDETFAAVAQIAAVGAPKRSAWRRALGI